MKREVREQRPLQNLWVAMGLMLFLFRPAAAKADLVYQGNGYALLYTDNGTSITITGNHVPQPTLVEVPAAINGEPVTTIGIGAFGSCTNMTDLILPDTISSMEFNAFSSCTALKNVVMPSGNVSLGGFANCTALTKVVFGPGVTSIGEFAFTNCSSLAAIYFQGNAPTVYPIDPFTGVPPGFTMYFLRSAMGFTTPTWHGHSAQPYPPGWAVRDFDGDGVADITGFDPSTGEFGFFALSGTAVTGSFVPMGDLPPPWTIAAIGDFNHDGSADLLLYNPGTGEVSVQLMNGIAPGSTVSLGVLAPSWTIVGLGNFDGTVETDILLQHASGAVGYWSLNGTTVTGFGLICLLPPSWTIAGVGDFSGDGQSDLLWYNPTNGYLVVATMNQATITGYQWIGILPPPIQVAGVADFTASGSPDLLLWDPTTGNMGILLIDGFTPATTILPTGTAPPPWRPID